MGVILKRLEWVLTGEVTDGDCPECGEPGITITDMQYECRYCGHSGELPRRPRWW